MSRISDTIKSKKFQEDLLDIAHELGDWVVNFLTLVVGAAVFGCAVVMTFFLVHRAYVNPLAISLEDALKIALIIVTAVYGIRIMKASDHLYRLFSRW